jgi:hypothetical protein
MDEYTLGIDIAEDRRHTSVVVAGAVEGDVVLVDLRAYIDGPDATALVVELSEERKAPESPEDRYPPRKLRAVAIDAHSPAATLIKFSFPLAQARPTPTSSSVAGSTSDGPTSRCTSPPRMAG